jgi:hypothetical protein
MYEYDEECLQTFLEKQGQLFDEPVAGTMEEAEAFLEDCMATVVNNRRGKALPRGRGHGCGRDDDGRDRRIRRSICSAQRTVFNRRGLISNAFITKQKTEKPQFLICCGFFQCFFYGV